MTTRILIATTLASALLLGGCAKPQEEQTAEAEAPGAETPAVDLAAEEEAIRNRSAEWMNYANAKDSATIVNSIYSPDAIAAFEGEILRGTEELQAGIEKDFKDMPDAVLSWNTTSVKLAASGDMAVEKGDFYMDPDGDGRKPATTGNYVTVWEKIDGEWRATTDVAAEGSAEAAGAEEATAVEAKAEESAPTT